MSIIDFPVEPNTDDIVVIHLVAHTLSAWNRLTAGELAPFSRAFDLVTALEKYSREKDLDKLAKRLGASQETLDFYRKQGDDGNH